MKLNPSELKQIVDLTLEQYNRGADEFWEGTRDHNVSQNIMALLQYIYGEPPFTILDFGCESLPKTSFGMTECDSCVSGRRDVRVPNQAPARGTIPTEVTGEPRG